MSPVELRCGTRAVGTYVHEPDLPARLSPRPYLHPLTTLGGIQVTELMPADHLHHLGASVAVPDLGGHNFWGGRTFVRGQGPTELDNHGVQRHTRWAGLSATGFDEELAWTAQGRLLLVERRTVALREVSPTAWRLELAFTLTNATGRPLRLASPAANGRPGAGYGGFFWRAPKHVRPPRVYASDGAEGERAVHGRRAAWLGMAGEGWTLVFGGADPWFVRAGQYPGVGSSLAWAQPLTVSATEPVTRRLVTVIADGKLGPAEAGELFRASAIPPAPPHPHPHPRP